jgi:predicted DCC family thiol-disulfide oxidoreductase YuxK
MITVFYDGKCGLCRREIEHYKRIAPAGVFQWVDITLAPEAFIALGYTVADGLKALHVRDGVGMMHIAVDAFIVIWQQLPRWRLLAAFARLPLIHPLATWCYTKFAAWRFKKLGYSSCEL